MKMRFLVLSVSHLAVAAFGFAAGIYVLPILIAPAPPDAASLALATDKAAFTAQFRRDLQDSDAFHWGEGTVSVGNDFITLQGRLAPGPDYKLYLSPTFVETESDFKRLKSQMTRVGDVRTFDNFVVPVPAGVDPSKFSTVIVWCESFEQFITSAKYQ